MNVRRVRHRRITSLLVAGTVLILAPLRAGAQITPTSCPLIVGGGGMAVRGLVVVYSAQSDRAGSRINGLVIVRASEQFLAQNPPQTMLDRFKAGRMGHHGGGGSVGPLTFVIDSASSAVWLNDSLSIPLKENNNVLLVHVDSSGVVKVSGQSRITSHFPLASGGCSKGGWARHEEARDTLWMRFQASPAIRAFIGR